MEPNPKIMMKYRFGSQLAVSQIIGTNLSFSCATWAIHNQLSGYRINQFDATTHIYHGSFRTEQFVRIYGQGSSGRHTNESALY